MARQADVARRVQRGGEAVVGAGLFVGVAERPASARAAV